MYSAFIAAFLVFHVYVAFDKRAALELNPGAPEALLLLGQALAAKGKRAEARQQFEAALLANPPFQAQEDEIRAALQSLAESR